MTTTATTPATLNAEREETRVVQLAATLLRHQAKAARAAEKLLARLHRAKRDRRELPRLARVKDLPEIVNILKASVFNFRIAADLLENEVGVEVLKAAGLADGWPDIIAFTTTEDAEEK